MNKKTVVTLVSILVVAGVLYKGKTLLTERQEEVKNEPAPTTKIDNVALVNAKQKMIQNRESYLGELLATKEITLSTKYAGYIQKLYVSESTAVKKGELLIKIDDTEILSNIKSLLTTKAMQEEDLALAKSTYARNKKLYDIGGLSKEKLELSYVTVKAKEAQLESTKQKIVQLNNQKEYLTIRAPFDGVVDRLFMHEGDLAPTAKPLLSLSNKEQKILFSYVAESAKIKEGDPLLYKGKEIAKVSTLYNSATNGLSMAEAKVPQALNMPLHSNINFEVITAQKEGCVLPTSTLIHDKDALYIITYKEKHFSRMPVTVEMQNEDEVLIAPCPQEAVASASEVKLKELLAYEKVELKGDSHE